MAVRYRIPYHIPHIPVRNREYVARMLASAPLGSAEVEDELQRALGDPAGRELFFTDSCTAALELAALALDLRPGDEVILPSYTYAGTANAFLRAGATLRFADIDPADLSISPESALSLCTDRTRVIAAVHYASCAADLGALASIAAGYGAVLIEDAAHCFGGAYRGRPLGTIAPFGALSFHRTKNITTLGRGGLLYAAPEHADSVRVVADQGTDAARFRRGEVSAYAWQRPGGNFGCSPAVLYALRGQIGDVAPLAAERAAIFYRYAEAFRDLASRGAFRIPSPRPGSEINGHIFYLIWPNRAIRDRYIRFMEDAGIEVLPHYEPLHSAPAFLRLCGGIGSCGRTPAAGAARLPETEAAHAGLVRLPIYRELAGAEFEKIDEIADSTRRFARNLL